MLPFSKRCEKLVAILQVCDIDSKKRPSTLDTSHSTLNDLYDSLQKLEEEDNVVFTSRSNYTNSAWCKYFDLSILSEIMFYYDRLSIEYLLGQITRSRLLYVLVFYLSALSMNTAFSL